MNSEAVRYYSGEEIRAGDRISYAGSPGTIVFVIASDSDSRDSTPLDEWMRSKYDTGFMMDVESTGLLFMRESDEDLELLGRLEQ